MKYWLLKSPKDGHHLAEQFACPVEGQNSIFKGWWLRIINNSFDFSLLGFYAFLYRWKEMLVLNQVKGGVPNGVLNSERSGLDSSCAAKKPGRIKIRASHNQARLTDQALVL